MPYEKLWFIGMQCLCWWSGSREFTFMVSYSFWSWRYFKVAYLTLFYHIHRGPNLCFLLLIWLELYSSHIILAIFKFYLVVSANFRTIQRRSFCQAKENYPIHRVHISSESWLNDQYIYQPSGTSWTFSQ